MVWFTIWFMVILKIPVVYLGFVIWWAVKDPPDANGGFDVDALGESDGGPGGSRRRERLLPSRRPGPHGSRSRRHARTGARRSRSRT